MRALLLAIILIIPHFILSQNKKDYLVTHSGDTLYGDVSIKSSSFIVKSEKEPIILNSDDVKLIKSNNYKGTTVLHCILHVYKDNLIDLQKSGAQAQKIDTVLLLRDEYLTTKINLYTCKDDNGQDYFFYKTPTDKLPQQLVVGYYLDYGQILQQDKLYPTTTIMNSTTKLVQMKGFTNQLKAIMGSCKKIPETMWESLDYRSYSLKAIIKKYNNCK